MISPADALCCVATSCEPLAGTSVIGVCWVKKPLGLRVLPGRHPRKFSSSFLLLPAASRCHFILFLNERRASTIAAPERPTQGSVMREIALQVSETIPGDVLAVRAECFPGPDSAGERGADLFDGRSIHLLLRESSQIAAYGRLTLGPPGVFRTWSRGAAQIPEGQNVADLGRCFVHEDYRSLKLLRLVCLEALTVAFGRSMQIVNGAYVPGSFLVQALRDIGFIESGTAVSQFEPNGLEISIQPVTCDLKSSCHQWDAERNLCLQHLADRGFGFRRQSFAD
jgi:hypothetical protein